MPSRKTKALLAAMRAVHPSLIFPDVKKQRAAQDSVGLLIKPRAGTSFEPVQAYGMPAAWVRPKKFNEDKVVLYCHGGAFMCGTLKYARIMASIIAKTASIQVFTFEYQLSPEYVFPCQLEDTLRAWRYLRLNGFKPENIYIVGESAGGNLVLTLTLKLRDIGEALPGRLVCMSPWTNLEGTGESYMRLADTDPTLCAEEIRFSGILYARNHSLRDPLISPVYGDFTGFPPTLIQTGTAEILMSDSIDVNLRMLEAGVNVTLELWEDMCHVFQIYPFKEAKEALARIAQFLNKTF